MFPGVPTEAELALPLLEPRASLARTPRRGRHLVGIGTACMAAGLINLGMAANRPSSGPAAPVATSAPGPSAVFAEGPIIGSAAAEPILGPPQSAVAPPLRQGVETFAFGPEPEQLLDVLWPGVPGNAPAIIYLHSGGWSGGARTNIPDFVAAQLENGWAIVSVDYRLAPEHRFPTASFDVDRAIRWTKHNALDLGIDPTRVVLAGGSAGGHLATVAAAAPGRLRDPSLPDELARIDPRPIALRARVAPTDLATLARTPGIGGPLTADFLACPTITTCRPEALSDASPIDHVTADAPPALFLYGELDTLVPETPHGTAIAAAWQASGSPATVITIQGAGHNLDLSTVDPTIVTDFLTRWLTEPLP